MLFPITSCPAEIRDAVDEFKDIVGKSYTAFCAVICATIFGVGNFSDIVRYFHFSPSVSTLCRLFELEDLSVRLNRRQRRFIKRILPDLEANSDRYLWAIDDTIIPHWGKHIWGTYCWHDHKTNGYVFGHKLLVLGIVDKNKKVFIPVLWEILHREKKKDTDQFTEWASHVKGWEVALKLLKMATATTSDFPKFTVVCDSWFSGNDFFTELDRNGFSYIAEIKSNRIVTHHGRTKIESDIADFFEDRSRHKIFYWGLPKWATCAVLKLNDLTLKQKIVAVANKKGLVEKCFAYYASNELTWDAKKIWGISRDRWAIEVQFRELKQLFALGEAAVRSKQAVETSISISMIALTVIRRRQLSSVDAKKNQYVKPIPASSIVQHYQLNSLKLAVTKLASTGETIILDRFRTRLRKENFGKKPTEEFKNSKSATGS
jgi:hypothetical protein